MALSRDGKVMAIGGVDGTVQVWDVETAQLRDVLRGHQAEVWAVALSSDQDQLVSGSLDGTLRLWDIRGHGKQLRMMRPDRPYERMNITGTTGLTDVQRAALVALGAVDSAT
jgi:WD40 repeat protein